jgi:cyclophilin family peptidyl-prolyl cis-trans isomerase
MRRLMMSAAIVAMVVCVSAWLSAAQAKPAAAQPKPAATANPVLVFETIKGTFEIELFQAEAPKSVAHILELMKRGVYRGQRFHRVEPTLVQIGDPQSRDMSKQAYWGTGDAWTPIGVFELSKKRSHVRGAVGLAYAGNPASADSQFYIMKAASPGLDGKYAIIGQVTTGMPVIDKIVKADIVKDIRVK